MIRILRFGFLRRQLASFVALACMTSGVSCTKETPGSSSGSSNDAATTDAPGPSGEGGPSLDASAESGVFAFDFSITLGGKKVPFDRGQFGTEGQGLYLELYDGGDPACPSQNSPTPKHTLIVSGLEKSGTSKPTVTLLDFIGDVITTPKPSRTASASTATMHVSTDARIELDLSVTFDADGGGQGPVVGTHCTSLDGQK